jgi:replicative DNA helicase
LKKAGPDSKPNGILTKQEKTKQMNKALNPGNDIGKVPPSAVEIEETVLGGLILESEAIEQVSTILTPECFYKDAHAKIYKTLLEMHSKQLPIDIMTAPQHFIKSGNNIDEVGGAFYFAKLTNNVASTAHIESHAFILFEMYLKREVIRIQSESINNAYDESEDVENVLSKLNTDVEKLNDISVGQRNDNKIGSIAKKCITSLELRQKNNSEGITNGIPSGLESFDTKTAGWQNSDLVILAGRPAMGKTALMLHHAKSAAQSKVPVAIYSLEMADEQLVDRFIIGESGINPDNYKKGSMHDDEWMKIEKGLKEIESLPIIIDQTPRITTHYIRSSARRLHKKGLCKMIMIDYLQLISWSNPKDTPANNIALITRELKLLAKELDVPIILLSQLNREVEKRPNKRPQLSDLKDSGSIEQDADMVLFAYRPAYYGLKGPDGADLSNQGKIIIGKYRSGATDDVKFYHNDSLTKISSEPLNNDLPF